MCQVPYSKELSNFILVSFASSNWIKADIKLFGKTITTCNAQIRQDYTGESGRYNSVSVAFTFSKQNAPSAFQLATASCEFPGKPQLAQVNG